MSNVVGRTRTTSRAIFLTVTKEEGRKRKHAQTHSTRLQALTKKWVNPLLSDRSMTVVTRPLLVNLLLLKPRPTGLVAEPLKAGKGKSSGPNCRPDDLLFKQLDGPWQIVDQGGAGDCFYRSAASAIAGRDRKTCLRTNLSTWEASSVY